MSRGDDIVMNEINMGEVYYIISRNRSPHDAEYFLSNIAPLLPIRTVSSSFPLVIDAARIKSCYPISFADACAAATAIKEGAAVVTGDREFRSLEKIVTIEWL
jgi:predicted nucleic acid-binding protein